jgi:hypothetical protein
VKLIDHKFVGEARHEKETKMGLESKDRTNKNQGKRKRAESRSNVEYLPYKTSAKCGQTSCASFSPFCDHHSKVDRFQNRRIKHQEQTEKSNKNQNKRSTGQS